MVYLKIYLRKVLVTFMVCLTINCILAVKNANQNKNIPERYFIPVTHEWQKEKCQQFKFDLDVVNHFDSTNVKLNKPLNHGLKDVKGDGNCYFRAISVWITGTEYAHLVLRKQLVEFMMKSPKMISYFNGREKLIEHLDKEKMASEGKWATDIEIRATAIMLNTTILIYADQQTNDWEVHHKSGDLRSEIDLNEKCIYLKSINSSHYQVVTAVEVNLANCKEELDSVFGLNTKAIDCIRVTVKNIMFSTANLDNAVTMYIHSFRSNSVNCDKILLPNDFCKKEAYGDEGDYLTIDELQMSPLYDVYTACIMEVSAFGDVKKTIFDNAISFHTSGEESLAWPGRNSSKNKYFIHKFDSFGDLYLNHITEEIEVDDSVLNPISFCEKANDGKSMK